uniref:Uncharacterized protein n=1 Tax=Hanusia phi TaxID=3032 RepID=A0A7S0ET63_9CRYP|mmetsp:Transcript_30306/g.68508  ORF Transcript_30306/g.68508 Transcript_30306/m.68508 type:complete len:242 (+) Transcript_30306:77-802(+)
MSTPSRNWMEATKRGEDCQGLDCWGSQARLAVSDQHKQQHAISGFLPTSRNQPAFTYQGAEKSLNSAARHLSGDSSRREDISSVHAQSSKMDAMAREINKLKLREVRYLQQIQDLRGVAARALSSTNPATPRTSSQSQYSMELELHDTKESLHRCINQVSKLEFENNQLLTRISELESRLDLSKKEAEALLVEKMLLEEKVFLLDTDKDDDKNAVAGFFHAHQQPADSELKELEKHAVITL